MPLAGLSPDGAVDGGRGTGAGSATAWRGRWRIWAGLRPAFRGASLFLPPRDHDSPLSLPLASDL
jgi:hypothetical protein